MNLQSIKRQLCWGQKSIHRPNRMERNQLKVSRDPMSYRNLK